METKFDLSKRIMTEYNTLSVSSVKEFIRLLKTTRITATYSKDDCSFQEMELAKALFLDWRDAFFETLNKLAGKSLTEEKT